MIFQIFLIKVFPATGFQSKCGQWELASVSGESLAALAGELKAKILYSEGVHAFLLSSYLAYPPSPVSWHKQAVPGLQREERLREE